MARLWTDKDVEILKNNYSSMTDVELGILLDRTPNSIERKRHSLKLKKKIQYSKIRITDEIKKEIIDLDVSVREAYNILHPKYGITRDQIEKFYKDSGISKRAPRKWTKEEDDFIKENTDILSTYDIAQKLNRTPVAISKRRNALGIKCTKNIVSVQSEKSWKDSEIEFLRTNIGNETYENIAKHLGRTEKAVMVQATRMNIITNGSVWTKGEEMLLKKFSDRTIYELVFILERSEKSIRHKAKQLGIKIKRVRREGSHVEDCVCEILKEFNIDFKRWAKPLNEFKYEADFLFGNVIIEIQGDYWHGNREMFPVLDNTQLLSIEKDAIKKKLFEDANYRVYYIWESEIEQDINKVKKFIAHIIKDNNIEGSKIGSDSTC